MPSCPASSCSCWSCCRVYTHRATCTITHVVTSLGALPSHAPPESTAVTHSSCRYPPSRRPGLNLSVRTRDVHVPPSTSSSDVGCRSAEKATCVRTASAQLASVAVATSVPSRPMVSISTSGGSSSSSGAGSGSTLAFTHSICDALAPSATPDDTLVCRSTASKHSTFIPTESPHGVHATRIVPGFVPSTAENRTPRGIGPTVKPMVVSNVSTHPLLSFSAQPGGVVAETCVSVPVTLIANSKPSYSVLDAGSSSTPADAVIVGMKRLGPEGSETLTMKSTGTSATRSASDTNTPTWYSPGTSGRVAKISRPSESRAPVRTLLKNTTPVSSVGTSCTP
mmetsp:Transcript_10443/g.25675  ORF Transcript_10443/g.25675 Transcript_10443/m.25675 type:complete len:338 (-) Transcript_10443:1865-2878(-)